MFDPAFGRALGGAALIVGVLLAVGCDHNRSRAADAGTRRIDGGGGGAGVMPATEDGGSLPRATRPRPQTDQLPDGVVGSACAGDADCGAGRCMLSETITKTLYTGGYCTGRCVEDAECGARGGCTPGFLGAVGVCYLRCDNDADCGRDGYRCRVSRGAGYCVPGPRPLPDHVTGNACSSDGDCGGGPGTCASSVAMVEAPGGYCTQNCALDADCGAGGTCISGLNGIALSVGHCYRFCAPPGDCRAGYTCRSFSGASTDMRGVCAPDRPASDAGVP